MSDHVYRARVPVPQGLLAALTLQPWQACLVRLASWVGQGKRLTDYFQRRALVAHVRQRFIEDFRRRWKESEREWEDEIMWGTGSEDAPGIFAVKDDSDREADHD